MYWLLLSGNRLLLAAGVVAVITAATLAILWTFGVAAVLPRSPMNFVYSSLLTGNLTLLTVVLSINQLVLSRELGDPGTLRQRVDATLNFRSEVEETTAASVTPKSPGAFLRHLHESVADEVDAVEEMLHDVDDADADRRLSSVTDSLRRDIRRVNRTLDDEADSIFAVIGATLSTTHAEQLNDIERVRAGCDDSLPDTLPVRLERIRDALLQIDVARNYFRTIYVQKELAYLSRVLLYVGVPAIAASGLSLLVYNAGYVTPASASLYAALVAVTVPLGFAPLAILFAFVLRLSWIAQRTSAIPPFSADTDYRP
ncbi:hypothetical protein SAMN06269185_2970 [Natronoarchaeum philippinense]|uniref:Uncharacterized protein n=2 Tax=Natronoarchaeum philippinense TaxID=558529 RepID=A0A285P6A7_NATPI|nr:hypothetical protein SAMN06269185_2970 [Natronoarchaeum philippinense]